MLGMVSNNAYEAASPTRRVNKTWSSRLGNSDRDDLPSLSKLRSNSRDADRNQPLVKGAMGTMLYNTIGGGLQLQSQPNHEVIGITEEEASNWAKKVEFEFSRMWGDSKNCDSECVKTFGDIQTVAFYSTLLSGDIIALLPHINRGTAYSMAVQLIEADRLSNPMYKMDTATTAGGITVGKYGEPKYYHIAKSHPGSVYVNREWVTVPAFGKKSRRRNVIHLAERIRPGQKRGVPILAPVMESLKVLQEYTTAELEAALVSGLFTTFIKTETGEMPDPLNLTPQNAQDAQDDRTMELSPGLVVGLKEGESIDTANPGRPNQAFDPFVMSIIKQIGAALQIPYELLIKHFSSSYSASRAALLEAWKAFKTRRQWFARNFCQPIYEEWLYEAVLTGRIVAHGFLENESVRVAYCTASWNGPQPGQLDPIKETNAALLRMEGYLSTGTKEAAEINGTDYEQNMRTAKRENKLREEAGAVTVGKNMIDAINTQGSNA
jgi:lambda family phage portal protein